MSSFGAIVNFQSAVGNWSLNGASFTNGYPKVQAQVDRQFWNNQDRLTLSLKDNTNATDVVFTGAATNGKAPSVTIPYSAIKAAAPWWSIPNVSAGDETLASFSGVINSVNVTGFVVATSTGLRIVFSDTTATVQVTSFKNLTVTIYTDI